jgi:hypothetical protein
VELEKVLEIVTTHRISPEFLNSDNFEKHMEFRAEQLLTQVRSAMGKESAENSSYVAEDEDFDEEN